MADEGNRASDNPFLALVRVLLQPLGYQQLAQAAVDAIPHSLSPETAVLGALLLTLDTETDQVEAFTYTHGDHEAAIARGLVGRSLRRLTGNYRRQSNLVEKVAAQQQAVAAPHLRDFLSGYFDEALLDRLEPLVGWQGGLAVPIPVQQRSVGVLLYGLRKPTGALANEERLRMTNVAHLVGLALDQARLYEVERRRAREMAALHNVLLRIATADDAGAMLEEILTAALDLLHADYAAVNTIPSRPGDQAWAARRGYRSSSAVLATVYPPGTGLAGRAMTARAAVVIEEFGDDPAFPVAEFPVHVAEGMQSGIGVPLLRPEERAGGTGEAFGALILGYRQRQRFTREQIDLAMTLAQEAAVALERARLQVNERRRAAELEATFQTVDQAMAIFDRQGLPVRSNRAMERLLGIPAGTYIGMTPAERARRLQVSTPDGSVLAADQLPVVRAVRGESIRANLRIRQADAGRSFVDAEVTATPLRQGGEEGAVLVVRDIGPELRHRRELEALIASSRQLSTELDPVALLRAITVVAYDISGSAGAATASVDRTSDSAAEPAAPLFHEWYWGRTWHQIEAGSRVWETAAAQAQATGEIQIVPSSMLTPTAAAIGAPDAGSNLLALPIRSRDAVLAVVLLVGKRAGHPFGEDDIRVLRAFAEQAASALENARHYEEERRARRDLEQAQEQGQAFLRIVAHELKTPLTNILGYAQLSQRLRARLAAAAGGQATDSADRLQAALDKIVDNCRRLQRLVDELQEAFRLGSGRFALQQARLDLSALVRQIVEEQQAVAPGHEITLTAAAQPIIGIWDPERLRQVLANLISNAIKYSPEGGPVRVSLRRRGRNAVLSVADRGLGIPTDDLPALFEPYSRLHQSRLIKGTGLGLYIVKGIVEAHGGSIRAQSPGEGEGATFIVTLPLGDEGRAEPPPTSLPDAPPANGEEVPAVAP